MRLIGSVFHETTRIERWRPNWSRQGERRMNRMRSLALPACLALGGPGVWGSSAAAQYVGGGTAYAPVYYYAPQQAAGPYYYAAPAPYFRHWVVVPGGSSGRNYPAPSGRPVPWHNFGLEPESLPAQIAEDTAPASVAPRLGPPWRAGWWRGRTWRRISRNW